MLTHLLNQEEKICPLSKQFLPVTYECAADANLIDPILLT